jgi:hypothetical protein
MRAAPLAIAAAGALAVAAAGAAVVLTVVIGEFADRHHLTLTTLTGLANDAGLHFRRRTGVPLAYYALLTPCATRP